MAAGKAQGKYYLFDGTRVLDTSIDSPCSLPRPSKPTKDFTATESNTHLSDIDADIEALTLTMQGTRLA
jgi:hypothetical protein